MRSLFVFPIRVLHLFESWCKTQDVEYVDIKGLDMSAQNPMFDYVGAQIRNFGDSHISLHITNYMYL